ncbi:response regulator [Konateibacter massiliensis]|uniref:response regulator n=1 Tax=Konateibacter massiliensis TaxID=2002841 RepID=UPI000C14F554|nr:response regulator [Konateibacter massiliensis]
MKKVLVVDDAVFMRLTIKTSLEKNGFQVVGEAGDGREAVEKFAILKPDIVTLDITMPEMSGIDTLKAMIQLDRNVKVIMVSAMGQEEKVKDAIMNGAKSFIVKPFKEEQLIKALEKIIPA